MEKNASDLQEFFEKAKAELFRANQDKRHPFGSLVLATLGSYPEQRTVVKRKTLNDLSTLIYTDERSGKMDQIQSNAKCSLSFYHSKKKIQVKILGQCQTITQGQLYEEHRSIALQNKSDYSTTKPPGTPIGKPEYERGAEAYFVLLQVVPEFIEILQLDRPHHKRARFSAAEDWKGSWLVA
ncbi:pyridoxamine 5'-phosphate oxidase family protein [Portibacter marinus]|uniref:pyridoxamine 5'-phosphate oxidase family protein n=1 Tax=Portibacter marinus TaxID=2898660 RepID=UPI001F3EA360|nr:pyridoxamine 5'-phosphate oxidase family protein [Portibacter marinus]